jgi:hypothetical protein
MLICYRARHQRPIRRGAAAVSVRERHRARHVDIVALAHACHRRRCQERFVRSFRSNHNNIANKMVSNAFDSFANPIIGHVRPVLHALNDESSTLLDVRQQTHNTDNAQFLLAKIFCRAHTLGASRLRAAVVQLAVAVRAHNARCAQQRRAGRRRRVARDHGPRRRRRTRRSLAYLVVYRIELCCVD